MSTESHRRQESKPAGPDLSRHAANVIGALVNGQLTPEAPLPPTLARLADVGDAAFGDPDLRLIAREIAHRRRRREPFGQAELSEALPDLAGRIAQLCDGATGPDSAERDAEDLWAAYQLRRAASVGADLQAALDAAPEALPSVIATARAALADVAGEGAGCCVPWASLAQDGAEIMRAEIPPPTELVDGLLTECGKFMIGGGSKSFKTWLLLDLALSISTGAPFLGRPTLRRRVLYCNLELRAEAFNRRVQTIARHRGIAIERGFFTHLPLRGKLAGLPVGAIVERVLDTARAREAQVVALDPLYKVNAGGDENDAGAVTTLFNELDRLTTEGGLTVLAADHAGKGNQAEKDPLDVFRGSSAKGADVDGAFVMRRHEVADSFTVDVILRELAPVPPFVLGWTFPAFAVRDDLDPAKMKRAKGGRKAGHDPVALLRAIEGTTPEAGISISRWAEAAGIARQTLQTTYLPGFRLKGWIATAGDGNTSRQYITETGRKHLNGGLE